MIQRTVYDAVTRRGYIEGFTVKRLVELQIIKATEELGECARHVFDGQAPPVEELADVVIPLLVAAEACGYDLLAAVLAKSENDVERGVRNASSEAQGSPC